MDRYIRYTPSHRVTLLSQLPGRRLIGISTCFLRSHSGAPVVQSSRAFGHADGLLSLGLSSGFDLDVTGFATRRSLLLRVGNSNGFRWAEHGVFARPDRIDVDPASNPGPLTEAIGKTVANVRILRTGFGHLSYQGRPSDAGLELEFEDGQRLIISQLLTHPSGVLTVSTPNTIDPEIAPHIEAVDIDAIAAPARPSLSTIDPFDGAAAVALREGRALLSSSLVDYDIFGDEVVPLDTRFDGSPAHVAALAAIGDALTRQNCSVTDIHFYLGLDGTVSLSEPVDVVQGVAPSTDLEFINVLTKAIEA